MGSHRNFSCGDSRRVQELEHSDAKARSTSIWALELVERLRRFLAHQ